MKPIKQCKLFFKEGKSDKVYEIDLCEVSAGHYLVNFRYGRRGTVLKEGTKTPATVNRDEAEKLFAGLEAEKRKKGYQTVNEVFVALPSLDEIKPDSAQGVIMHRLQDAAEGRSSFKTKWKTSRVIWKAAYLNMQEAIPYIIKLTSKGDEQQTYAGLYALLKLKAKAAEELFRSYTSMAKQKQYIRNIAHEGLLSILEGEKREIHVRMLTEKIPADIRYAVDAGHISQLQACLEEYSAKEETDFMTWFYLAYRHKPPIIDTALQVMKCWELRPPFFKQIRAIYKLAQAGDDMATVAAMAYKFETVAPMFNRTQPLDVDYSPQYIASLDKSFITGKELRSKDSKIAYSNYTKHYLQRHSLDFIKSTGAKGDAKEYLRLAIATLLQYTDNDYTAPGEKLRNQYGTYNWNTRKYHYTLINYAECSRALMLSMILFGNDPDRILEKNMSYILGKRHLKSKNYYFNENQVTEISRTGICGTSFPASNSTNPPENKSDSIFNSIKKLFGKKEQPESVGQNAGENEEVAAKAVKPKPNRPELYPEYWDIMPESYIMLLMKSQMSLVQKFAWQNLSQHARYEDITDKISSHDLWRLFDTGYEYPGKLAMCVLLKKNEELASDKAFVTSLLATKNNDARKWARQIINQSLLSYADDTGFIFALLFNPYDDCTEWITDVLQQSRCNNDQLKVLIGKAVSELQQMKNTPENNRKAEKAIKRLNIIASQYYNRISWDVVTHLLSSELEANIVFAGNIIIKKTEWGQPEEVPFDLVRLFLEQHLQGARENGMILLDKYPDSFIRDRKDAFVKLANTVYQDVLIKVLGRTKVIARTNRDFGNAALHHLIYVLIRKEKFGGAHTMIKNFILADLREYRNQPDPKDIIMLIHANYRDSQLTGYELLKNYDKPDDFSMGQIVSLGNHEILAIRQWCWKYFKDNAARIRYERQKALGILDSKWDDTRTFAFHFFKTEFSESDWDADTLIGITDSVRKDVENFGKDLIMKYFNPDNAPEYLTKLSEHPSTSVQMFVSGYLIRYASGQIKRIKELEFYFRSTLTRVNKGRVAKDRIFGFLQQEALQSEESARYIAGMIDDLSAQTTVQDKASCINILTEIKNRYPQLDMHLTVIY